MTPSELEAIEQRAAAASPPPWDSPFYWDRGAAEPGSRRGIAVEEVDADFIAHAREDVPRLLAEVRRLQAVERVAREILPTLERARRGHYYCEDGWYSCPKAEDGCYDKRQGTECNCGADEKNAALVSVIAALRSVLQGEP